MHKRNIIKAFFIYGAGNYVSQAFGMLSGFLMRIFLAPYYMGLWQGFSIIKSYASYMNLGVSKAATREIPYFRGKKYYEKADRLKNTGFSFSMIAASFVALGCVLYAFIEKDTLNPYVFWGFITIGLVVMLERLESYVVTILRAKRMFFPESLGKALNSILNIILIIILVRNFKLYGLYFSNIIVYLFSIVMLFLLSKEHFSFVLRKEELKNLIKVGVPLVMMGFMFMNLINVDKLVILKMLGPEKLGLYSIAIMAGNLIYDLSNIASIILYPRFQEMYGRSEEKKMVYARMLKVIGTLWLPCLLLVTAGSIILPYVIRSVIPKYIGGIAAMQIYFAGIYFLSLSLFCADFLVTINKQVFSIIVLIAVTAVNFMLSISAVKLGFGIEGVAFAASVSYFIYFLSLFAVAYFMVKDGKA